MARFNRLSFLIFLSVLFFALSAKAQTTFTLQKALQTAKVNNPMLKSQQLNVGIAETDVVTAGLRPNLTLNNQTLQLLQPSAFQPNTEFYSNKNRQVWWQLTKVIQLPDQRKYQIDFAKQNVLLNQRMIQETERNLFFETASKWLEVWGTRKQLDILQIAKKNIDSLVVINKLRLKNQVVTQTDLTRTELLANQYALQIKNVEQVYKNQTAELKLLMGVRQEIVVDTSDSFLFAFSDRLETVLQQALTTRSDVATLQTAVDVAYTNIQLQKALAFPKPELGVIWNPQNSVPYLGFFGTIALPFFSRNQGEIKKSNLIKQQAEQDLITARLTIETELSIAYNTYQTQKTNLQNFKQMLKQSEAILNSVRYAYLRGGSTIIDFLEAQRSWLDTQQLYYETQLQYRISYIQLLYASGMIHQLAQ